MSAEANRTVSLRETIQACRKAGRREDFAEIIATVDATPQLECRRQESVQTTDEEDAPQIISLLGYKGYALMKLGQFSEALPFLEESFCIRRQLEQQIAERSEIRAILNRPIVQREVMAVEEALETCHEKSARSITGTSVVTGVTPETLLEQWREQHERVRVIAFYQDRKGNPWREFSNFYRQNGCNFDFLLPLELLEIAGIGANRRELFPPTVNCDFSEKAMMLCKAAVMGDDVRYAAIANADTPMDAKQLGRRVSPWYPQRWNRVVCGVALAVLRQKFALSRLRDVLLSTGDKILCEATAGDKT
mmetsp:Transcript_40577/g.69235  ORF Transcript_40577/g.69235 Transcript_40577/m.69235 type:complete len:306 (-) Transcript_40577:1135-2052(-)